VIFDRKRYDLLNEIVFASEGDDEHELRYPGYRPEVKEIPNGDGKVDATKRFAHIALKYLDAPGSEWMSDFAKRALREALAVAHFEACRVAEALGVPAAFYPRAEFGALRLLEYPPGAGSEEHTDFDLFTVLCYRETPGDLELLEGGDAAHEMIVGRYAKATDIDPHLHIGEIGELVGLGPATPHRVPARDYVQRSIVYFAIPDHAARLPRRVEGVSRYAQSGEIAGVSYAPDQTVGEWLKERLARSRVYK
jgi:hypothetical protein